MSFLKIPIFISFFSLLLGGLFFFWGIDQPKDLEAPREILFSVGKGQDLWETSQNLEKEGLILNQWLMRAYVLFRRKSENLKAGKYQLSSAMSIRAIAEKIIQGDTVKIKIAFPEGLMLKEIEKKLNQQLVINHQQSAINLSNYRIGFWQKDYEFLQEALPTLSLEGFLFPDTYFFEPAMTSEEIVKMFLDNFDQKLTPELRKEIQNQGKTIFEVVTMASMLEKEVRTPQEKSIVSGILWKRMSNRIPLQIDATIIYLTGKKSIRVSQEETRIDSPYNTYRYPGLPLGPISNPGIESIHAAIFPEASDSWYYLSTLEGKTIFSRSLDEHNLAKAEYLD